jgi:serine/threonine protein kinase
MSHTIRGTPTYMAPEQWSGEPVPATDQYALAIMAYELLAGRPPFQGPPMRLMHLHAMTPPPPPSTFNPRLRGELDVVLLHALAKEPEQRFASMTAFATAFQQAVHRLQEPNAPRRITPTPTPASTGDIHTGLAISTTEAQMGTTRTLTLPGGRQVRVPIPAGVRDGQIVRLEGQGQVSSAGGLSGALILTLLVKAAEELPSLSTASTAQAEQQMEVVPVEQPPQRGISRRAIIVGSVGLALAVSGSVTWLLASGPITNLSASSVEVHMDTSNFVPTSINLSKGGSINLVDTVSYQHIIENGMWDASGNPTPARESGSPSVVVSFSGNDTHTIGPFNTPGTFHFYCTLNPGMNLTVIVQ